MSVDVPTTYGALLLGGLMAAGLSGIVTVQSFVYIKLYPDDPLRTKSIVATVWLLDTAHTALVCASIWIYLIANFGDTSQINMIPWSVALTIALTAILTFLVHCFFAHRIYRLTRRDWRITGPLAIFAFLRLGAASLTTAEMIHTGTFSGFKSHFRWVFTLGLALSSFVDVLIAIFLCYSLRSNRKSSSSMDYVINSVILYTFENGSITCTATIISMICWLVMPNNLIFMGLHFVISKLYANSLLATLLARRRLQRGHRQSGEHGLPVVFPEYGNRLRPRYLTRGEHAAATKLQISVEKTVEYEVDESSPEPETPGTEPIRIDEQVV